MALVAQIIKGADVVIFYYSFHCHSLKVVNSSNNIQRLMMVSCNMNPVNVFSARLLSSSITAYFLKPKKISSGKRCMLKSRDKNSNFRLAST